MKRKLLYCLTAILALGFVSCKDDDEILAPINPAEDLDRMPMTMFRLLENTNISDDPYGMRVITEERNTVELAWYGVEGAAGYEIKYGVQSGLTSGLDADWDNPDRLTDHFIINDPKQLTVRIQNLEYKTAYRFAIRVLHPDGIEEHHSKWYGYGNGREWAEQAGLTTEDRYAIPRMIEITEIAPNKDAFKLVINLNIKNAIAKALGATDETTEAEIDKMFKNNKSTVEDLFNEYKENYDFVQDGTQDSYETAKFKVSVLKVAPGAETPEATLNPKWADYTLDLQNDFTNGVATFMIDGLSKNSIYVADVLNNDKIIINSNNNKEILVDARYNSMRKPVYDDPGDPITIEHVVDPKDLTPGAVDFEACSLDTIIGMFPSNPKLAEGQVFYLRGGKAYYFSTNPTIAKGFTLATLPSDLEQGLRAKVYLGGIGVARDEFGALTANLGTCNFMFGREKQSGEADFPIEVGTVRFENIDFDCPLAYNYGHQMQNIASASGNYFANMYSGGMEVNFKSLEIVNCTFQRMVRGFIRTQGSKPKYFDQILIEGNLFYNCGYYDQAGSGYAWIASDGTVAANVFKKFVWRNNTMYDCPRTTLLSDNNKNNTGWASAIKWDITVENNTFVNFSTRSSGRNFFGLRYMPGGSKITFKKNLFVQAKDENDQRDLYFSGADLQGIPGGDGSGSIVMDFADNYSVDCLKDRQKDDKTFTGNAFTKTSKSFGAFLEKCYPDEVERKKVKESLVVKVLKGDDGNPITPTQLLNNPNPPYVEHNTAKPSPRDHEAPADIFNALKYKAVPSTITEKNVGDPRWR